MERRIRYPGLSLSSPTGGRNTASPLGKVFTQSVTHVRSPWAGARTQHREGVRKEGGPIADLKSPWALGPLGATSLNEVDRSLGARLLGEAQALVWRDPPVCWGIHRSWSSGAPIPKERNLRS